MCVCVFVSGSAQPIDSVPSSKWLHVGLATGTDMIVNLVDLFITFWIQSCLWGGEGTGGGRHSK